MQTRRSSWCVILLGWWLAFAAHAALGAAAAPWQELFDGRSLEGWNLIGASEGFQVEEGTLVAGGAHAHLYYAGAVGGHDFKDFQLQLEVKTDFGSDSGVYFHTAPTTKTWPEAGYEVQINNDYVGKSQTGSLSSIRELADTAARNGEWFELGLVVQQQRVRVTVNGEEVLSYQEETPPQRPARLAKRILSSGTIALQAHPRSGKVRFRNIRIRSLATAAVELPAAPAAPKVADATIISQGRQFFAEACAACHQTTGAGIAPIYPPLAGSEWVNGNADRLASLVLFGVQGPISVKGSVYSSVAMPAFRKGSAFDWPDEKVAVALSYIRQEWGNQGGFISPDDVRRLREKFGERAAFAEAELLEIK